MTWLAGGVALWWLGHLFKRIAPGLRAQLGKKAGRGVVTVVLLAAIALMVIGYRQADPAFLWGLGSWAWHVNNLLMLIAIILLGMGQSKGRMRSWLRHPMLTGVVVWAVAHLLVNGDLPSLILFGGLAVWALAEMAVIGMADGPWQRPEPGPISGDIRLLVICLVVYAGIVLVHWQLLGVKPFL